VLSRDNLKDTPQRPPSGLPARVEPHAPQARWAGGRHSSLLRAAASGCALSAYPLGHDWALSAFSKSATHPSFPCNGPAGGRDQGEGEREEASRLKGERAWRERGDEAVAVAVCICE